MDVAQYIILNLQIARDVAVKSRYKLSCCYQFAEGSFALVRSIFLQLLLATLRYSLLACFVKPREAS